MSLLNIPKDVFVQCICGYLDLDDQIKLLNVNRIRIHFNLDKRWKQLRINHIKISFIDMMADVIPIQQRSRVLTKHYTEAPFELRVERIKSFIFACALDKVRGIKLKNRDAIDRFFSIALEQYNGYIDKINE